MENQDTEATTGVSVAMLDVPKFSLSSFNVTVTPTEVVVLGSSNFPGITADGKSIMGQRPEVFISASPQAAKELMVLLQKLIPVLEADVGEITTPWLKEQAKGVR